MTDLIIVGGGPGGYEAALTAAKAGLTTVLIEKEQLGGACLNRGCIPTKSLLASAEAFATATNDFAGLGLACDNLRFDWAAIQKRKNSIIERLRRAMEQNLQRNGVELIRAEVASVQPGLVRLTDGRELTTSKILLATGAAPVKPPIPGANLAGVITSNELLEIDKAPQSLLIVGGGVIGVEFAGIFNALGCKVTIVEALPRLLTNCDAEAVTQLTAMLKKRGIGIYTEARVSRIEESAAGLCCFFEHKQQEKCIESELILLAVGRRPAGGELIGANRGIKAETLPNGIWAIGDCLGGIQLAHLASAQGAAAVRNMLGKNEQQPGPIPACLYSDPELAEVGINEETANLQGIAVEVRRADLVSNGRALIAGRNRGLIKLVFAANGGPLLGATLLMPHATEMIDELTAAIKFAKTAGELSSYVRPHPTLVEALNNALL